MDLSTEFLARARHSLGVEYPTKIRQCLDVLPPDALWRRGDEESNSVGNLLLHLSGNVRQWLVASVGGAPDSRSRSAEFAARGGADAETLWEGLRATLDEAGAVLAAQSERSLLERRTIQGRDVSVLDAVFHVVEHFALHTGQIVLLTKRYAPGRIRFYEDAGGLAIPRWRDSSGQ
jgi:uncharacterized damage-inducible protein DinB